MTNWPLVCGIFGGIVAVVLIALFGATSAGVENYDRNAMAAWIQAIGSIAAIVGAVWAVKYQGDRALRERREAFLAVAEAAKTRAEEFAALLERDDPRPTLAMSFHQSIIDGLAGALSGIPVHELKSREGVIAMLTLRDQIVFLGRNIQTLLDGAWELPGMRPVLENARQAHPDDPDSVAKLVRETERILANNALANVNQIRGCHAILARDS